ncbi:MAG TPA: protein phosphatase 2C domain-containing protein [Propionibacteriaceae bacterium]
MPFQLRFVTHSEIGLVRKNNQDSGFASAHLLVVADGMGGAAAGDLASAVAIDTIKRIDGPTQSEHMLEVMAGAIHRANDRIADLVEADTSLDGMGTTVTGALFDGADLGLAHIGDSRAYLLREGRLERLTHDHSWVQSLVDEGKISPDEAAIHPHRSLLLKVLNGQTANDPDLTVVSLALGDRLMFCSDGVCGLLDDPIIAHAMGLPTIEEALDHLVAESLAEGGIDNITVIVADVVESGGTETPAVLGAAAERTIPPIGSRPRDDEPEDDEDTVVTVLPPPVATDTDGPEDEARYNPQAPNRHRFLRPLVGLVVLVLIIGAGLGTAYAWTRTQYFVGASGDQVTIFKGLSESIPGITLSQVYEIQPLTVSGLPPYYREKVLANIDVSSLDSARETVAELSEAAKRCNAQNPTASPTPGPSSSPSGKPSPTSVAPSPSASAAEPSC